MQHEQAAVPASVRLRWSSPLFIAVHTCRRMLHVYEHASIHEQYVRVYIVYALHSHAHAHRYTLISIQLCEICMHQHISVHNAHIIIPPNHPRICLLYEELFCCAAHNRSCDDMRCVRVCVCSFESVCELRACACVCVCSNCQLRWGNSEPHSAKRTRIHQVYARCKYVTE